MKELAFFDPLNLNYKSPVGVITKNKRIVFKVEVNQKCSANNIYLFIKEDNDQDYKHILMTKKDNFFETTIEFENTGHYFYYFKLEYNDFEKYLCKSIDNFSMVLDRKGEDFFQLATSQEYAKNNPLQGGIIYQIMVDRFCKTGYSKCREPLIFRDDWGGKITKNTTDPVAINKEVFGGDLFGVASKLDYLKSLNISAIYLNPIFLANSNHKYDTADYMQVDEMFGGDFALEHLIFEANKRNIKIIIDGVFNHTGSDSVYFNKNKRFKSIGAYNSRDSKFFDWYTFYNYPDDYSCWWGINTLPSIKHNCFEFQNFIAGKSGVLEKYFDMGIFGIRLDVVDEISDDFAKLIFDKVKTLNSDSMVIGEVWEDASTKISYSKRRKYFLNNEINSVMNYLLKDAIFNYLSTKNTFLLFSTLRLLKNNYPKEVLNSLMNIVGTHDTKRVFSEIKNISNGDMILAKKLFKIIMVLLFTLPGIPSIFYGDEYGMENNSHSSRGCFDWENYKNDNFEFVKKLTNIRKISSLKNGEYNIIFSASGKFVFERYNDESHIVVFINLRSSILKVFFEGEFESFFGNKFKNNLELGENEFEILIAK